MEKLRSMGLTPTIQRVAVLEYLESTKTHPTADQVLAAIRKAYPSVSRATVYNTLEALTKAGAILKLSVDTPAARYDADFAPHGHFQCRVCGKLEDIDLPDISCLEKRVGGHHVETVRAYAYGVCADCREQQNTGSSANPKNPGASSNERQNTEQRKSTPSSSAKLPGDENEGGRPDA